jgi:hypothetical protein
MKDCTNQKIYIVYIYIYMCIMHSALPLSSIQRGRLCLLSHLFVGGRNPCSQFIVTWLNKIAFSRKTKMSRCGSCTSSTWSWISACVLPESGSKLQHGQSPSLSLYIYICAYVGMWWHIYIYIYIHQNSEADKRVHKPVKFQYLKTENISIYTWICIQSETQSETLLLQS